MLIQDIIKPKVFTIESEASMEEAFRLLMQHNIHHLIVMESKQVRGVITAADVASIPPEEQGAIKVRQCMSRDVVCLAPESSLKHAAELMQMHHFDCLPICKGGELVGVITAEDLLAVFCRDIERLERENVDWCSLEDRPPRWQIHPWN